MNKLGQAQTDQQRRQYLEAMGIQTWSRRQPQFQSADETIDLTGVDARQAIQAESFVPVADQGIEQPAVATDWAGLQAQVSICTRCELSQHRNQTVFGVGNRNADWLVIGEAPGADEDAKGEPFVGAAGKLLNQMLLAVGLKREEVYIANTVKCRPPNNRDPKPEEADACEVYLKQQIALIQPKVIFAVGRIAAHNLLKTDQKVGEMRGQRFEYGDSKIPLVVSYHPAYLLRTPSAKRKAWQDLLFARQIINNE